MAGKYSPPATPSIMCKLSLKACTLLMVPAERDLYTTHKAGSAAQSKGCSASFELPDPVYFGYSATLQVLHNTLLLNDLHKMPAAQTQQAFQINHDNQGTERHLSESFTYHSQQSARRGRRSGWWSRGGRGHRGWTLRGY